MAIGAKWGQQVLEHESQITPGEYEEFLQKKEELELALNEKEKGIPRLRKENLTTRQELRKLSSPMKGVSEASWDKLMASNVGKQKFNEVVKTRGLELLIKVILRGHLNAKLDEKTFCGNSSFLWKVRRVWLEVALELVA